jgi:ferredoxin
MKITADLNKCIGGGQCVLAAPDVFDQRDEDGLVIVLNPNPTAEQAASVHEAARLCPAAAIMVED